MRCKQTLPFNGAFAHVVRMSTLSAAPSSAEWLVGCWLVGWLVGGICPDQVIVCRESVSSQTLMPIVHDPKKKMLKSSVF